MRLPLLCAGTLLLAACSSSHAPSGANATVDATPRASTVATVPTRATREIADLPDHRSLLAYVGGTVSRGASTMHAVEISESHALGAIVSGTMELAAPDGTPIRLRYDRHIEHNDGNWTWVGHPEGAKPGDSAIVTFGDKAVFGTVSYAGRPPLRITTMHGRTYVVETDPSKRVASTRASGPEETRDFATPPMLAQARDKVMAQAAQAVRVPGATPQTSTIDLVVGYTNSFATNMGGQSQAITRLTFAVDETNLALRTSQVIANINAVGMVAVEYPDSITNETALWQLTGVSCSAPGASYKTCTAAPVPAALQPLVAARNNLQADLMTLVRPTNVASPGLQRCGMAWLLGAGQTPITQADAYAGVSVVGGFIPENNGPNDPGMDCNYPLAHAIGHNLGLPHDIQDAKGSNGTLEPGEYGRYADSFAYVSTKTVTIMGIEPPYDPMVYPPFPDRAFSNPDVLMACGDAPCGIAGQSNAARTIRLTAPIVAAFQAHRPRKTVDDFDGDGYSDILLRFGDASIPDNVSYWAMDGVRVKGVGFGTVGASYKIAATGDFNGDGKTDIVWTSINRDVRIWFSDGTGFGGTTPGSFPVNAGVYPYRWTIAGAGDVDGDGKSDLLFRNGNDSIPDNFSYWIMDGAARKRIGYGTIGASYRILGTGDFNGDGKLDIVWTSANLDLRMWFGNGTQFGGSLATPGSFPAFFGYYSAGWLLVSTGDVNGDGKADLVFNTPNNTRNSFNVYLMDGTRILQQPYDGFNASIGPRLNVYDRIVGSGDYNSDGLRDLLLTSSYTGKVSFLWSNGKSFQAKPDDYPWESPLPEIAMPASGWTFGK